MTIALERPDILSLAAGFTDNQTLPLDEVTALAVELGARGDKTVLQYGSNQGRSDLRQSLVDRLNEQDRASGATKPRFDAARTFISNGSQQALYLAAQTLCDPGDIILVENPTYFVFLEMLRGLGVTAIAMPMQVGGDVDTEGLADRLRAIAAEGRIDRVKAVYLVSYFANPTGHTISSDCKRAILRTLGEWGGSIALIEDAAYRELYFHEPSEGASALGLADADCDVPIFYTTTLTKPFASGLKIGFAFCSHADWLRRMLAVKGQQDFGSAQYNQALLQGALTTGAFDRRLQQLRVSYRKKMEALDRALAPSLRDLGWSWQTPLGGLYLWLAAPEGGETGFDSSFHARCIDGGVMYVPGQLCHADGTSRHTARLSFGVLQADELAIAGARFATAAAATARCAADLPVD